MTLNLEELYENILNEEFVWNSDKIYISGPYGRRKGLSEEECEANVKRAIEVARKLILEGYNPFVPHLFHYIHIGWNGTLPEERWLELCKGWISACRYMFMMRGWATSEGAVEEHRIAKELGLEIIYEI